MADHRKVSWLAFNGPILKHSTCYSFYSEKEVCWYEKEFYFAEGFKIIHSRDSPSREKLNTIDRITENRKP